MNVAETSAARRSLRWLAVSRPRCRRNDAPPPPTLFLADGLWRDVLAFTWTIETMSGRAGDRGHAAPNAARAPSRETSIFRRSARRRAGSRAPAPNTSRRCSNSRPRSAPATASLRLVPDPQSRRGCAPGRCHDTCRNCAATKKLSSAARRADDATRDFGAANWLDRRDKARAYADHDPAVHRGRRRPGRTCRSPRACSSSASTR